MIVDFPSPMKRARKSFPVLSFTVMSAMLLGFLLGGYPRYTNEISTISLFIAMTFSLAPISFKGVITRDSLKFGLYSIILNYGLLSGLILLISFLFENGIRYGFVVMAAVPPAVMVMPLTSVLKGKTEYALLSSSIIYLLSILLTPLIVYLFLGEKIDSFRLIYTTLTLIVLPLILSRAIRRLKVSDTVSRAVINICFFILIFGIIGKNRGFIFYNLGSIFTILLLNILRTFGPGITVLKLGRVLNIPMEKLVPLSLFSSFKNDGLAILICLSLFTADIAYVATIPCIVAVIVEMCWAASMEIIPARMKNI